MDVTQVSASAETILRPANRSAADPMQSRTETAKETEKQTEKPRKAEDKKPEAITVNAPDLRYRASGNPVQPSVIEVLDSSGKVVRTIPPDSSGELWNMSA